LPAEKKMPVLTNVYCVRTDPNMLEELEQEYATLKNKVRDLREYL